MKFLYFLLFNLVAVLHLSAQNQRFIHCTFPLDTATTLELDLFGEYTVENWVGDAVMIETQVSLYNAPEGVFNYHIEQGRYKIEEEREGETLTLKSKDKDRRPIKIPKGNPEEKVTVKVFIPDVMKPAGDKRWERPKENK